jgi:hypothetical protein
MATYDYQHLLDQTFPTRVSHRQHIKTRYAQTLSDFPNNIDFLQPVPENGLVVLAESRSTAGHDLKTQPAHEYRFAFNNWQIEIDTDNGTIKFINPDHFKNNSIKNIKCLYNHIEFLSKLSDYETMHYDVYTKGRFRLSSELSQLICELIRNIQTGIKYEDVSYATTGLTTKITQEPVNTNTAIVFNGWVYTRNRPVYNFKFEYPEVIVP